jgi:hypothetical protein
MVGSKKWNSIWSDHSDGIQCKWAIPTCRDFKPLCPLSDGSQRPSAYFWVVDRVGDQMVISPSKIECDGCEEIDGVFNWGWTIIHSVTFRVILLKWTVFAHHIVHSMHERLTLRMLKTIMPIWSLQNCELCLKSRSMLCTYRYFVQRAHDHRNLCRALSSSPVMSTIHILNVYRDHVLMSVSHNSIDTLSIPFNFRPSRIHPVGLIGM